MKTLTHAGIIKQAKFGTSSRSLVKLRETKCYWITEKGTRYRKETGSIVGLSIWDGVNHLELDTVKLLPKLVNEQGAVK